MPAVLLEDIRTSPLDPQASHIYGPDLPEAQQLDKPPSVLDAAFDQENLGTSLSQGAIHQLDMREAHEEAVRENPEFAVRPEFDRGNNFDITEHIPPEHANFAGTYAEFAHSPQEVEVLKSRINAELENERVLNEAGAIGFFSRLSAAVTDPTVLIPGGVVWKAGKLGPLATRAASAIGTSVAFGVATGAQEIGLQESQLTRNAEESNTAIVASMIMGLGFGALIGKASSEVMAAAETEMRSILRGAPKSFVKKGDKVVVDPDKFKATFKVLDCP